MALMHSDVTVPTRVTWVVEASNLGMLMEDHLRRRFGVDVEVSLDRDDEYPEICGAWLEGETEALENAGIDTENPSGTFICLVRWLWGSEEITYMAVDLPGGWGVKVSMPFELWFRRNQAVIRALLKEESRSVK